MPNPKVTNMSGDIFQNQAVSLFLLLEGEPGRHLVILFCFLLLWILFVLLLVLLVVVALPLEDTRGTLGCSLFTTHVDGSNAPGTLEEEYLRWWLLVSLTSQARVLVPILRS